LPVDSVGRHFALYNHLVYTVVKFTQRRLK
jgi:hypothetical protein